MDAHTWTLWIHNPYQFTDIIYRASQSIQDPMDESGKVLYNLDVEMTLNFYIGRN